MKIYDITQEMFTSNVYPGDKAPEYTRVRDIRKGDKINLTEMYFCVHNGTHMDAPKHFVKDGKSIDQISLERCLGECTVAEMDGDISREAIEAVLKNSRKRLLIKGNITISLEAAKAMNDYSLELIGIEGQSVGTADAPMNVHLELLQNEVAVLEGLDLSNVLPGEYFLSALPLKLGESDGAPCRAVLFEME